MRRCCISNNMGISSPSQLVRHLCGVSWGDPIFGARGEVVVEDEEDFKGREV